VEPAPPHLDAPTVTPSVTPAGAAATGPAWRTRLEPRPVALFCAVTLFIWGNRIWLAWTNPDDTVAEKLVWSTPITLFVLAALVLGGQLLAGTDRRRPGFVRGVTALAAGTTLYWAVRTPMILLADHPVGFEVVHAVLAAVSVTLAVAAWRSVRSSGA
jgi:hypothetical protein